MQPVRVTVSLASAVADGIAQSQTPVVGGNLTLNGSLVSGGVATLTAVGIGRQVIITSGGNDTSRTFTIYGISPEGNAISEALAGASGAAAASNAMYSSVSRVTVDAATASTVTVGTNGVGASAMYAPDPYMAPFSIGIGCVVVGTVNYTVQHTFNDVYSFATYAPASYTWFSNSGLSAKTSSADGNYAAPVAGIRLLLSSGNGSVAMTLIQAATTP